MSNYDLFIFDILSILSSKLFFIFQNLINFIFYYFNSNSLTNYLLIYQVVCFNLSSFFFQEIFNFTFPKLLFFCYVKVLLFFIFDFFILSFGIFCSEDFICSWNFFIWDLYAFLRINFDNFIWLLYFIYFFQIICLIFWFNLSFFL